MKNLYLCQPQYRVDQRNEITYYLPYSAGCLWSYVSQFNDITDNFCLKDLLFKRDPIDIVLNRIDDPAVFGFSCYVWNEKYCLALAEKVKEKYPKCLIVFGGPQSSGKMISYDFIDIIVMAEGEEAFLEILRDHINGISPKKFYTKRRLENLDIPSPYTTGVFERIMLDNPTVSWAMTLETNRGCPYSCTFCDWGSVTYGKVKKFTLERVREDIEWIAKWPVTYMFCADANFGILKERDLEIAKMLRDIHTRSRLDSVNITFAKYSSEVIFEIAKILGPLNRGVTVSVQSMNEETLDVVKRGNMAINNITKMIELSEQYGVFTYTETILGLPLETLESWKQGMVDILEMGQHQNIDMYFGQLLENSELNSPNEKLKYGIKSIKAKDYMTFANNDEESNVVEEIDLICETNTMPLDHMVESYMYGWMIIHFHIGGYSQILSRYCRNLYGIGYRKFYDLMFDKLQQSGFFQEHFLLIKSIVDRYLRSGELSETDGLNKGGFGMYAHSYTFLYDNQTYAKKLAQEVAEFFVSLPPAVVDLHENFLYDKTKKYPLELDLDFNVKTWKPERSSYVITPRISLKDKFDLYSARRFNRLRNNIDKKS